MIKTIYIVGAGLYGSVIARELAEYDYQVKVIEKRDHIGGNCYDQKMFGTYVQKYGPHIFHTVNDEIWDYVNKFDKFIPFVNAPKVKTPTGKLLSLPVNMNTFNELWGITDPEEAIEKISDELQKCHLVLKPKNFEEAVKQNVGTTLYKMIFEKYTAKQWGRKPSEVPASVGSRLPIRMTFNNNYFDDTYQGIPRHGYTYLISKILNHKNIQIFTNSKLKDFISLDEIKNSKVTVFYTAPIDELFKYKFGNLEYRSLKFKTVIGGKTQCNQVINYNDDSPFTRIAEYSMFPNADVDFLKTVKVLEYPQAYKKGRERFYPVDTKKNMELYKKYSDYSHKNYPSVHFGGRLGLYRYINMDVTVALALGKARHFINTNSQAIIER